MQDCFHLKIITHFVAIEGFMGFGSLKFCLTNILCGSRKYPYSPHRRDWKFRGGGGGGGGVSKTQKFKAMYEVKLEFPEGWGGGGGYGYFLEPHIGKWTSLFINYSAFHYHLIG